MIGIVLDLVRLNLHSYRGDDDPNGASCIRGGTDGRVQSLFFGCRGTQACGAQGPSSLAAPSPTCGRSAITCAHTSSPSSKNGWASAGTISSGSICAWAWRLQRNALDDYVEDGARGFAGRRAVLTRLLHHAESPVRDGSAWGVCLTGDPGSGKSAIFGELLRRFRGADALVLAHAASASLRSSSVEAMLRRWIEELAAALGVDTAGCPTLAPSRPVSPARLQQEARRSPRRNLKRSASEVGDAQQGARKTPC